MCSFSWLLFMEERSPLDCVYCKSPLISPVLLDCLHTVCANCAPNCSEECKNRFNKDQKDFLTDDLAQFLINASQEKTECCANCDTISQPMFFCETCQQCLCNDCKLKIHSAKMFLKHQVINAEDRILVRTVDRCDKHGESFMSFDFSTKKLLCFKCFNKIPVEQRETVKSIEDAQCSAMEKLGNSIQSLKIVQESMNTELRNANESANRFNMQAEESIKSVHRLCEELNETIIKTRDKIISKIEEEKLKASNSCEMYISAVKIMQDPIRLCLLGGQILPCVISPIDVLNIAPTFFLRVERLINKRVDAMPNLQFNSNSFEERSELAKALEPYLGLSAAWCPISAVRDNVKEGSGSTQSIKSLGRFSSSFSYSDAYALKQSLSFSKVSNPINCSFGQQFGKVEAPISLVIQEILDLSAKVQGVQRDLTIRRCLVKPDNIKMLAKQCQAVEGKVGMVSSMLDNMQPELQQIWQEALDNVRRQQIIYRDKVEEVTTLRATVREVLIGAKQLASFASCIENMSAVIDPKRTHPPDPAPMESICQQISTIEPDSDTRIAAIEKEEQHRRANQEAMRKREEEQIVEKTVKGLKHGKQKRKDINKFLLNTCRDRSPGGTDSALMAPIIRRSDNKWEYSSDTESVTMSETFDAWPDCFEVDISKDDPVRCSSSLSVPMPSPSTSTQSKSPTEQMFTSATYQPSMHENMMQSLRTIFAINKETEQQSNILASFVKTTQRKTKDGDVTDYETFSAPESKPNPTSPLKKQVRRRKKRSDAEQPDVNVEDILEPLSLIPQVPFVPSSVFEQSVTDKLGSFEAKEKVLQSLREKLGESPSNDSASLTE